MWDWTLNFLARVNVSHYKNVCIGVWVLIIFAFQLSVTHFCAVSIGNVTKRLEEQSLEKSLTVIWIYTLNYKRRAKSTIDFANVWVQDYLLATGHVHVYTHTVACIQLYKKCRKIFQSALQDYSKMNVTPFAIMFAASDSGGGGEGRGKLLAEQLKVPLHLNFE